MRGWGNITIVPTQSAAYDLNGKRLWAIAQPKQLSGKEVYANGVQYDFNFPKLGDVFGTWLYHGSYRPFLITSDGLYAGTLLEKTLLGPASLRGESALYYYQGPNGTPYVINGANQAEHIFQIEGLNQGGRFEGTFQLTDNGAKLAAMVRATPKPVLVPKPVLAVTWLNTPPMIDGDLSDWDLNNGASLDGSNGKSASIALGRDANNLYLAYKVNEPNPPMRNRGSDWRNLFISGDCVDLMLQTVPKADRHRRAAAAATRGCSSVRFKASLSLFFIARWFPGPRRRSALLQRGSIRSSDWMRPRSRLRPMRPTNSTRLKHR